MLLLSYAALESFGRGGDVLVCCLDCVSCHFGFLPISPISTLFINTQLLIEKKCKLFTSVPSEGPIIISTRFLLPRRRLHPLNLIFNVSRYFKPSILSFPLFLLTFFISENRSTILCFISIIEWLFDRDTIWNVVDSRRITSYSSEIIFLLCVNKYFNQFEDAFTRNTFC